MPELSGNLETWGLAAPIPSKAETRIATTVAAAQIGWGMALPPAIAPEEQSLDLDNYYFAAFYSNETPNHGVLLGENVAETLQHSGDKSGTAGTVVEPSKIAAPPSDNERKRKAADPNEQGSCKRTSSTRGPQKTTCEEDDEVFPTPDALQKHILEYHKDGFRCRLPGCESKKIFETAILLQQHKRTQHGIGSKGRKAKSYKCGHCDYTPSYFTLVVFEHMYHHLSHQIPKPTNRLVRKTRKYINVTESLGNPNILIVKAKVELWRA